MNSTMLQRIKVLVMILVSGLFLSGCEKDDGGSSGFDLINAYDDPTRFNILFDKSFSGKVSYIISSTDLRIVKSSDFDTSSASKTEVTVSADDLSFNDYIRTASLGSGTEYHVYILDKNSGKLYTFVKSTRKNEGSDQVTGEFSCVDGSTTVTIPYSINFPHGYDANSSKKWPLLLSLKAPNFTSANNSFPCITFNTDVSSGSTRATMINKIRDMLKTIVNSYNVDRDRIYACGFSNGGCAVVEIASNEGSPDYQIRAMVPVSIANYLSGYCANLGDTDTWLFYGDGRNDSGGYTDSCAEGTQNIQTRIPSGTGEHLLTGMPGTGHDAGPTWASPYTFMWLFSK